jgi:hypothetical protein
MQYSFKKSAGMKESQSEKNENFLLPNRKNGIKIIDNSLDIKWLHLFSKKQKKSLKITILVLRSFGKNIKITPVVWTITVISFLLPSERVGSISTLERSSVPLLSG